MMRLAIYFGIGVVIFILMLLFFKRLSHVEASAVSSAVNTKAPPQNDDIVITETAIIADLSLPVDDPITEDTLHNNEESAQADIDPQSQPDAITEDLQPNSDPAAIEPQSEPGSMQPITDTTSANPDTETNDIERLTHTTVFELNNNDATIVKPVKSITQTETAAEIIPNINSDLPRNEEELSMIIASKDETLINLYCRAQTIKERNDIVRFAHQAQLADKICAISANDQEAINTVDNNMVYAILKKARGIEQELLKPESTESKNDRNGLDLPAISFEKDN